MKILTASIACFLLLWTYRAGSAYEGAVVDIEIVLAVDASGSVDKSELELQVKGIAAAFRDPEVQQAIARGPLQKVLVSMLIWSDAAYSKNPTEWYLVDSPESAEIFAARVEKFTDRHGALTALGGGSTGLGDGLAYALEMIKNNDTEATRRIVDVSGDGPESQPWNKGAIMLPQARTIATALKVTVNGLAIEAGIPGLTQWYRNNVMTGPGSFVMSAKDFHDYERAIKKKLLRELSPVVIG